MSHILRQILKNYSIEVNNVIEFFICEAVNKPQFDDVVSVCSARSREIPGLAGEQYIKVGYLSAADFQYYATIRGLSHKATITDTVLNSLLSHNIIKRLPSSMSSLTSEMRYKPERDYAVYLQKRNLIMNMIGGWNYIIRKFSKSVFKIVNYNSEGDQAIGSGFYYAAGDGNSSLSLIITNKHVIDNAKSIKIFTVDDVEIQFDRIVVDPNRDLSYIILREHLGLQVFHIYPQHDVLTEILTIGYPSIPMSKEAYQVSHKGEINSFIEDYKGSKFFLFSAKTSSGNSGSPIIDPYGMAVGIITEDLFEKTQFFEKGKPSYYAGIPGTEIINSLNEVVFGENGKM